MEPVETPEEAPNAVPQLAKPRSYWKPVLLGIGGVILLIFVALGVVAWQIQSSIDRRLDAAIADADRLDPGWRLEEVFANRFDPPDGEDSADHVLVVIDRLPEGWPGDEIKTLLDEQIKTLEPTEMLLPETADAISAELDQLTPAVTEARGLADMGPGHFDVVLAKDPFATLLENEHRS